jgi:hypothetical protein
MQTLPSATEIPVLPTARTKTTAYRRQGNDPSFDLRGELHRISGVDLTDIPGVSTATAQVILTEVGPRCRVDAHSSASRDQDCNQRDQQQNQENHNKRQRVGWSDLEEQGLQKSGYCQCRGEPDHPANRHHAKAVPSYEEYFPVLCRAPS